MLRRRKKDSDLDSRLAILWMHPEAILRFMTSFRWVVQKGQLPEDVKFQSVYWDPERNVWAVVCKSKDFKSLKMGEPIPELPPVAFRWYNPDKDGPIQ
jgi:hypothetical protein